MPHSQQQRRLSRATLLACLLAAWTTEAVRGQIFQLQVAQPAVVAPAQPVELPEQTEVQADTTRPRLELQTGDYFSGSLAPYDQPGKIAWQADALSEPLVFPLGAAAAVQFPLVPTNVPTQGEFGVELLAGDVLFGAVEELTADTLTLATEQFGTLHINRSEVRGIERWGALNRVIYMGPAGMQDWLWQGGKQAFKSRGGRLEAELPGTIALTGHPVPGNCLIELELSWRRKADFSLRLAGAGRMWQDMANAVKGLWAQGPANQDEQQDAGAAFELTTVRDYVVLVSEGADAADVAVVGSLSDKRRKLHLQIRVNPAAGTIAVYSPTGNRMAEITCPLDAIPLAGGVIELTNRRGDVRLDRLVIRDTIAGPPIDLSKPGIHVQPLGAEPLVVEELTIEHDGDAAVVRMPQQDEPLPLAQLARIDFSRRESAADDDEAEQENAPVAGDETLAADQSADDPAARFAVRVATQSGLRLHGNWDRASADAVTLSRAGIAEPFEIPLVDLQAVEVLGGDSPASHRMQPRGELVGGGVECRGALVGAKEDPRAAAGQLVWRPLRSETASPLHADFSGRITYVVKQTPEVPERPGARRRPNPVIGFLRSLSSVAPAGAAAPAKQPVGDQLLWLKTGDRISCRVTSIDESGVHFTSSMVEAKFVPHELVKAWDRAPGVAPAPLDERKMARLLTLPRMQRNNPPRHVLQSTDGDYLRARLLSATDETVEVEQRLETRRIPVDRVARIIWLDKPEDAQADKDDDADPDEHGDAAVAHAADQPRDSAAEDETDDAEPGVGPLIQAVRSDGVRLTLRFEQLVDGVIGGRREALGAAHVDLKQVDELLLGDAIADAAAENPFGQWQLTSAPNPRYLTESGEPAAAAGQEAGLVGQPAPDFRLKLLAGGEFQLEKTRGKVVVLEFWATWCGFCMQAMPRVAEIVDSYPEGDVVSIAVNLREDADTITPVLERMGLEPTVALDIDGATAEKFQVTGLPQTVIVGADGNVANVFVGAGLRFDEQLRAGIDAALAAARGESAPADEASAQ